MGNTKIRVSVVGLGAWGRRILKTLLDIPEFQVVGLINRSEAAFNHPQIKESKLPCHASLADFLKSGRCEIAFVCTQAASHFPVLLELAEHGISAFVEKPFCTDVEEAETAFTAFKKKKLKLHVDHTYLYSSTYQRFASVFRQRFSSGKFVYTAQRLDLGSFPTDVGIFSHLTYHDLYMLDDLLGLENLKVTDYHTFDASEPWHEVFGELHLRSKKGGEILLVASQIHPRKSRLVTVTGTDGALVWDDLSKGREVVWAGFATDIAKGKVKSYSQQPEELLAINDPAESPLHVQMRSIAKDGLNMKSVESALSIKRLIATLAR